MMRRDVRATRDAIAAALDGIARTHWAALFQSRSRSAPRRIAASYSVLHHSAEARRSETSSRSVATWARISRSVATWARSAATSDRSDASSSSMGDSRSEFMRRGYECLRQRRTCPPYCKWRTRQEPFSSQDVPQIFNTHQPSDSTRGAGHRMHASRNDTRWRVMPGAHAEELQSMCVHTTARGCA